MPLCISQTGVVKVSAQSSDDPWSMPVNLSKSGGTSSPLIIIDPSDTMHVVWEDNFYGTIYSHFVNNLWSEPLPLTFPFSNPIPGRPGGGQGSINNPPVFVADSAGVVYAFWNDLNDELFVSSVASEFFGIPGSWSPAVQLAEFALDFDIVVDEQGSLHVAYVRALDSLDFPSGVYYRNSLDGGLSWSVAEVVYLTPYFRSLTPSAANVDIEYNADFGSGDLYLVWDNQPRKQVLFSRSQDGGATWDNSQVIANPSESSPTINPLNIRVKEYAGGILLLWQSGDPAVSCIQYFQTSMDSGFTWSEPLAMLQDISGCPQEQSFLLHDDLLILMTAIQGQVYLLAWDKNEWSLPQLQRTLSGFEDPETFSRVVFDCRKPVMDQAGNLVVVGCDTGAGADIWLTRRQLGDINLWFPLASVWNTGDPLAQSTALISSPIPLYDSKGRQHLFWIQQDIAGAGSGQALDAIFYSRSDNGEWTRPNAILRSPVGVTHQPSAAIDANDNLYIAWAGGQSGEIYFSRASADRASSPSEWVMAITLPMVQQVGSSPDIHVSSNGTLYVIYAVPLNEQRGVYLTRSSDSGFIWSEPVLVFDAALAGWDMVDRPHLSVEGDVLLNAIFSKVSLAGGTSSRGLYATRSSDDGGTWADPYAIIERPESWSELLGGANGALHRAWIDTTSSSPVFQHQVSYDQGVNWSLPASVSTVGTAVGAPALTGDPSGQLHLLQGVQDSSQRLNIRTWRWDGSRWLTDEALDLSDQIDLMVGEVSASISNAGEFSVVYSGSDSSQDPNLGVYILGSAQRVVEFTDPVALATPPALPQVTETPTPIETLVPSPTATIAFPTVFPSGNGAQPAAATSPVNGLIVAAVLAGLVALIVFIVSVLRLRTR